MRRCTYRLQLRGGADFDAAGALADYLGDLGVSHLYVSPIFRAAAGSTHGYDIVDYEEIDPVLGGRVALGDAASQLATAGLGLVIDIVPNHMGVEDPANRWWRDVLTHGPASRYASYFDIDWDSPDPRNFATVVLPILGDRYGAVLDRREIRLSFTNGAVAVAYGDHRLPVAPRTMDAILLRVAQRTGDGRLADLAAHASAIPHALLTDPATKAERRAASEAVVVDLGALVDADAALRTALDETLAEISDEPAALDDVLARQNYRLIYWRAARDELDYRRFFNIDSLVGVRMENPEVFGDAHRLVVELASTGVVDTLRVDHVDGLRDPARYLELLAAAAPTAAIVVEKILGDGETLPDWPIAGTTGYEFLTRVNRLQVDDDNRLAIMDAYQSFIGQAVDYGRIVRDAKLEMLHGDLAPDLQRLARALMMACEDDYRYRDFSERDVRAAIRAVMTEFDRYRVYPRLGRALSAEEEAAVRAAVAAARRVTTAEQAGLLDLIEALLCQQQTDRTVTFAARFQQLAAATTAKGIEDTAFYRFHPLVSLNEVGGEPDAFGLSVEGFHHATAAAGARWPEAMVTLSTHDAKRGADVRARINVLSEIPGAWQAAVARWSEHNKAHRHGPWPDRNTEYLVYQTLVGAWPIDAERLVGFVTKATREAKVHTSWAEPDPAYDDAVESFVRDVLGDDEFVADVGQLLQSEGILAAGRENGLAQTTLLLTCPGIPDIYQGTELWDLSLVDPDNRRPVDFGRRRILLARVRECPGAVPAVDDDDGYPKLWLMARLLAHRAAHPGAYGPQSSYRPVDTRGPQAEHVVAFARGDDLAVVVPRLARRRGAWRPGTTVCLPGAGWTDVLTGTAHAGPTADVATLLGGFPVAVLTRT